MTRRRQSPDDIVTRGGLTRREIRQGYINATPEQNKAFALAALRDSMSAEHDATIWHDNGESVEAEARTAGVRVVYVHVDLAAGTCEYRTVEGGAA